VAGHGVQGDPSATEPGAGGWLVALSAGPAAGAGCLPTRGPCQHSQGRSADAKRIKGHPAALGHSYRIKYSFARHLKTNHACLWQRRISSSELKYRNTDHQPHVILLFKGCQTV